LTGLRNGKIAVAASKGRSGRLAELVGDEVDTRRTSGYIGPGPPAKVAGRSAAARRSADGEGTFAGPRDNDEDARITVASSR
jgi:hypothetical protein